MPGRSHREDPLTPQQRGEFEEDLISFCDRELALIGDIRGLDVLYAGGSSPLWIEGLSQRIGWEGSLTTLELDEERVARARELLGEADLAAPVRIVPGDVFEPPFEPGSFDLVYSAGLFHELDVRSRSARDALGALVSVARRGGRVCTGDFVDTVPAAQLEDEEIRREIARLSGKEPYGIGPPEQLVALHEALLEDVRWRVLPPYAVRHMDGVFLDEDRPAAGGDRLRERYEALRERVRREGYTRPATVYVEGRVI